MFTYMYMSQLITVHRQGPVFGQSQAITVHRQGPVFGQSQAITVHRQDSLASPCPVSSDKS